MSDTPRGWLLDTNVVSELRKNVRANPAVRAWGSSVPPSACYLSVVTIAELRFGIGQVADTAFQAELQMWLRDGVRVWFGTRILPVDEAVLLAWRQLASAGQKANYTYAQPDGIIAATALVHDLGIATRNVADFRRSGVRLINPWG